MGTNSSPEYPWPGGTPGAEAPDPVAGKPGHFAWSRWIKQYVKNLNTNLMAHQDSTNPHPNWAVGGSGSGGGWAVTDPVKDFGAKGDGVSDDTVALQNAINADKPIALGSRTYKISSALTLKSGTRFFGDRAAPWGTPSASPAAMIVQATPNQHGLKGVDVYDILLENVRLEGPGSGTGDGINLTRSTKAATNYISMKNVYVRTFGRDGISISNCIVSSMDRVICESNGQHGFNLYGVYKGSAGTSVALNGCYANNNKGNGFVINSMTYMGFNACASEGHAVDFDVISCQGLSFTGCGSEDNKGISWRVSDASYGVGLYSCWNYTSKGISVLVTGNSHSTIISGFVECDPVEGQATVSTKVDIGSTGTVIIGGNYVKPRALAPLTTTVLDGGGGDIHANDTFITGSMWLDEEWDTRLWRAATGIIRTDAIFRIGGSGTLQLGVNGDANLYRIAPNALGTDGTLAVYGPATDPYHVATKAMVDAKLALTGGVLTGNLTIDSAGHALLAVDRGTSASLAQIDFLTAGVQDFALSMRGTGATKGLFVYSAGAAKDVLAIDYTTGLVVVANDPTGPMGVATKQYVDNKALGGGGGGGLDQATADGLYVNVAGDTMSDHLLVNNADRLKYGLTVNRTVPSTTTADNEIFRVLYQGLRATWTNEKGNLRTSNEGAKGEVALKIIAASTAEGGTGNMLEVLDIAGNVQTRIGPLGRQNFYKGIRMVGDTIEIQDSTGADTSTLAQILSGDLTMTPKRNITVKDGAFVNWANDGGIKTNGAAAGAYSVAGAFTVKSAAALNLTGASGIVMNGGSGHLNVNYMRIMNMEEPSAANHGATKNYVDTRTPKITVGTTAPSSPAVGDIWVDTN